MRLFDSEWFAYHGCSVARLTQQLAESDCSQANAALTEKPAARDVPGMLTQMKMSLAVHGILTSGTLFLGDSFIEVQQHARDNSPRRRLRRRRFLRQLRRVSRIVRRQLPRLGVAAREALLLFAEKFQ